MRILKYKSEPGYDNFIKEITDLKDFFVCDVSLRKDKLERILQ